MRKGSDGEKEEKLFIYVHQGRYFWTRTVDCVNLLLFLTVLILFIFYSGKMSRLLPFNTDIERHSTSIRNEYQLGPLKQLMLSDSDPPFTLIFNSRDSPDCCIVSYFSSFD